VYGTAFLGGLVHPADQALEEQLAHLGEQRFLGIEILVDRSRRVIDGLGQAAHGNPGLAIGSEYRFGRVDDRIADAAPAAFCRRDIFKRGVGRHK
jgi:hypothetical protein